MVILLNSGVNRGILSNIDQKQGCCKSKRTGFQKLTFGMDQERRKN